MRLSLWLLLPALIPSSQEICSAPGALLAPILHLNQTSAQPGDSVRVKCFMLSQDQVTRVFFCKEREEVSSQRGSKEKATYDYDHVVSRESSGNYSCGYEMKDKNNQVTRSQLSPAKHLSITGDDSSSGSGGAGGSLPPGLDLKLLLGITVPTFLLLAVVLYLLGKKGNVAPSLITLSRCFQLGLCGGSTGNASSVTPTAPCKIILSVPQRIGQKVTGIGRRHRYTRTSHCSRAEITSAPALECRAPPCAASSQNFITESRKVLSARKCGTLSGATAGQCGAGNNVLSQ